MAAKNQLRNDWQESIAPIALGIFSVVIVCTMMLPSTFGLLDVRQWAGMYTDTWCQVVVASGDPSDPLSKSKTVTVGRDNATTAVWTAPSHTPATCLRWTQEMLCNRSMDEGWSIAWAQPFMARNGYFMGTMNACAYPLRSSPPWFSHASL